MIGHRELHRRLLDAVDGLTDPVERLTALVRTHVFARTDFRLLAVVTTRSTSPVRASGAPRR
ncbi:hypothetical protein ACPZ19_51620 [Amycolatopsis lurida]